MSGKIYISHPKASYPAIYIVDEKGSYVYGATNYKGDNFSIDKSRGPFQHHVDKYVCTFEQLHEALRIVVEKNNEQ